jgi:hypothetical protein
LINAKNPKIIVEVYNQVGLKHTRKYPVVGHTVVIRKGHKGKGGAGLAPTFKAEDVIPFKKGFLFKKLRLKLLYNEVANKFINPRAKVPDEIKLTWEQVEAYFQAQVVKSAGAISPKIEIPLFLWLLLIGNLGLTFLLLLGVRFG